MALAAASLAGLAGFLAARPDWGWAAAPGATALALLLYLWRDPPAVDPAAPAPRTAPDMFSLLDGIHEPCFAVNRNMLIMRSNPAARHLFGSMLPGEPINLFLRNPVALDAIAMSIAARAPTDRELTLLTPAERTFAIACSPVAAQENIFLVLLHDITRLKLADRMRADFVANASHELRTPLATLIGFLETLHGAAGSEPDTRIRFLAIMSKEADRMARLIDDLLSLSKIEMDKHIAPVQPLDLKPLFKDVGSTLAMRLDAESRFIKLELADPLPNVIADRDQILQVLHNLISNALKYGRNGTPITVTVTPAASHVRVSVADEGDGIAPEHLPRLTERFYRADTARSRDLGGTGLGLAIVKHIIERHRGELTIDSRHGVGTTVSFTLPRPVSDYAQAPQ